MAKIIAKKGGDFVLIPADSYVARCVQMVHIGTRNKPYKGTPKMVEQVRITWELYEHLVKDKDGKDMPALISQEYTLSMGAKANLLKMLTSWRGKPFTPEEIENFDVSALVKAPCLLQVIHNPDKKDATKIYANVGAIQKLPKSMVCPEQVHESIIFGYNPFEQAVFDRLSDYAKKLVMESDEFKAIAHTVKMDAKTAATVAAAQTEGGEAEEDDAPF